MRRKYPTCPFNISLQIANTYGGNNISVAFIKVNYKRKLFREEWLSFLKSKSLKLIYNHREYRLILETNLSAFRDVPKTENSNWNSVGLRVRFYVILSKNILQIKIDSLVLTVVK